MWFHLILLTCYEQYPKHLIHFITWPSHPFQFHPIQLSGCLSQYPFHDRSKLFSFVNVYTVPLSCYVIFFSNNEYAICMLIYQKQYFVRFVSTRFASSKEVLMWQAYCLKLGLNIIIHSIGWNLNNSILILHTSKLSWCSSISHLLHRLI